MASEQELDHELPLPTTLSILLDSLSLSTKDPTSHTVSTTDPITPSTATSAFPFLSLPGKIRNLIYRYSMNWNEATSTMAKYLFAKHQPRLKWARNGAQLWRTSGPGEQTLEEKHIRPRSTPTILLLNRQITREALGILRDTPLVIPVIELSHPSTIPDDCFTPWINTDFIAKLTLRTVRKFVVELPTEKDAVVRCRHTGLRYCKKMVKPMHLLQVLEHVAYYCDALEELVVRFRGNRTGWEFDFRPWAGASNWGVLNSLDERAQVLRPDMHTRWSAEECSRFMDDLAVENWNLVRE